MTVHGPEQIHPPPTDLNVGFVHMPGGGRVFHLSSQPLVNDRTVLLTPAPDGRVIDRQSPLGHHFLHIAEAERKPQVPTDASRDDFRLKMTSTENGRAARLHRTTLKANNGGLQHFP